MPPTTAVQSSPPAVADEHAAEGRSAFYELDLELQAELVGERDEGGAAPIRSEEEEDGEESEESEGVPPAAAATTAQLEAAQTVFEAAKKVVRIYADSGCMAPFELPVFLTREDRAKLHGVCEELKLSHDSVGDAGDRRLKVGRRGGGATAASGGASGAALGGDIMEALAFAEAWADLLVKYDPRHWMGNWFLMAQSKSSELFKYFCIATSNAIFEVQQDERERLKKHLRTIFKHGVGVNMEDTVAAKVENERVDELIKRVRRSYFRSRCMYSIPKPKRLAERLLIVY